MNCSGTLSLAIKSLLILVFILSMTSAEECTRCCCKECTLTRWTPHYNGCGGEDHIHTAGAGTKVKVYSNGCQPCANGRVLSRIIGQKGWAYFPSQFLSCSGHCNYYSASDMPNFIRKKVDNELTLSDTQGTCKSNGQYTVKSTASLRDTPSGLVCTNLSPGEHVTVTKCNPGSHWCRVQANSPSCRNLKSNYCNHCTGYMLCQSL